MGIARAMKGLTVAAAMAAVTACSLDKQTAPPLAGPSEFSHAIAAPQASSNDPTAAFIASPGSPRANVDVVNFNASGAKPAQGRVLVQYEFHFGDGTIVSSATPTVQHVYVSAGDYTALLRVTDDLGKFGVATQNVKVVNP